MKKNQRSKIKDQNEKLKCKKPFLFLLFVFVFILGGAAPALATEYKTYTSESIDAGDKVYHVQSCKKVPAFGILYCNEKNKDQYGKQCKNKKGELLNVPVKMCVESDKLEHGYPAPKGDKPAAIANYSKKKAQGGCSDEPDDQGYVYAPLYAIAEQVVENDRDKFIARGTIAWGDAPDTNNPANLEGANELINEIHPGGQPFLMYKSALCGELDVFQDTSKGEGGVDKLTEELLKNAPGGPFKQFVESLSSKFNLGAVKDKCNTNNIEQTVEGFGHSPDFGEGADTDTYSCTIYERISGASGSDIFGKYVSALYRWAAGLVGIVAVLTMVYSGIQISMAGGDTAKLDSAKNRIMQSIVGLVILFLSGLILYTINPGFFTG